MPGCCLTLAIRDPEWVFEGWESKVLKETSTQDHPAHARLTYTTPRTPSSSLPHPRNSTLSIPIAAVPNPQPSRNREKCPPRRCPFTLPADGTLRPTRLSRFRNLHFTNEKLANDLGSTEAGEHLQSKLPHCRSRDIRLN